jgi:predicted ATPase
MSIRNNLELNRNKEKTIFCKEELTLGDVFFLQLSPFNLQIFSFNTETIRNKSHRKSTKKLIKDGSNLGQNLFNIKKDYPDSFNIISNSMIGVVNEIDGIDVQETFGNYLIGFQEKNQKIGIDMVSDGTINLLATITALNQDEDKSMILAFDEPERYLHMKAVHYLMDSFRSSKKQILITTHSTEILKYADLNEVIFIYRDSDGDTQSIRGDEIPNLKEKMEHITYERSMTLDEMLDEDMVWDFE